MIPGEFAADRTKRPHIVRTLTARCANARDAEDLVEWLVHFEDSFFVECHAIERMATAVEIAMNQKGAKFYGAPVSPPSGDHRLLGDYRPLGKKSLIPKPAHLLGAKK